MDRNKPWEEKWEELEPLGAGGQGETYRAQSKADAGQFGALKKLKNRRNPQARRRMAREVVNLATVHQAGGRVPRVLDHNVSTDVVADGATPLYLVMELVEGETLSQLITRRGKLPLPEAAAIAIDLCRTIHVAHGESVLHRDLKPDNVMVRSSEAMTVATILDYGLSFNDASDGEEDLTQTAEAFRNPFLFLPEHLAGQPQRETRSDLTAVAALFYYMLTGLTPGPLLDAHGRKPHERDAQVLDSLSIGHPMVGHRLRTFFAKAFAQQLDLRFQTMDELVARIQELDKGVSDEVVEDPIAAATRASELLHRHSRPTILERFRLNADKLVQEVNALVNTLGGELQKKEVILSNAQLPEPKSPAGMDRVNVANGIQVQLRNHTRRKACRCIICADREECVVYHESFEIESNNRWRNESQTEVLRYPGSGSPPSLLIVPHFRTAIARMIDDLVRLAARRPDTRLMNSTT